MRKVSDYQQHADECRAMARKTLNAVQRRQLEEMAEAWAMLADVRRKQLQTHSSFSLEPADLPQLA